MVTTKDPWAKASALDMVKVLKECRDQRDHWTAMSSTCEERTIEAFEGERIKTITLALDDEEEVLATYVAPVRHEVDHAKLLAALKKARVPLKNVVSKKVEIVQTVNMDVVDALVEAGKLNASDFLIDKPSKKSIKLTPRKRKK